jgi:hypothetical protein
MTTLMTEAAPTTEGPTSTTAVIPPFSTEVIAPVTQQTDADKVAADQAAADAATAAKGEKAPVPETYADFKLPEGETLPDDLVSDIKVLAKDLSLTQEQAQKVAEFNLKHTKAGAEKQQATLTGFREQWVAAAKVDKEFGGDKLAANLAVAKHGFTEFASPELRTMLDETGFGDHPEVVRMFFKIGQKLSGDTFVPNGGGPVNKDPAKVLFPNQN